MKISQLTVENIRGINLAVLDNLGDVVAIAGSNGCGKSCLLDCVRLFKSQYGSYNQNESSSLVAGKEPQRWRSYQRHSSPSAEEQERQHRSIHQVRRHGERLYPYR